MDDFRSLLHDRTSVINLLVLAIMLLAIPVGIQLIRQQQIFRSNAAAAPIEVVQNKCIVTRNGQLSAVCGDISVQITSPLGGPAAVVSPSPATN